MEKVIDGKKVLLHTPTELGIDWNQYRKEVLAAVEPEALERVFEQLREEFCNFTEPYRAILYHPVREINGKLEGSSGLPTLPMFAMPGNMAKFLAKGFTLTEPAMPPLEGQSSVAGEGGAPVEVERELYVSDKDKVKTKK